MHSRRGKEGGTQKAKKNKGMAGASSVISLSLSCPRENSIIRFSHGSGFFGRSRVA